MIGFLWFDTTIINYIARIDNRVYFRNEIMQSFFLASKKNSSEQIPLYLLTFTNKIFGKCYFSTNCFGSYIISTSSC